MARCGLIISSVGLVVAALGVTIVGCTKEEDAGAISQESAASASKYKVAFASLSAEDRALAVKQAICPVSGEPLGAMGTPRKILVKGHDVFICCEGCESELKDNPDEYLAKLGLQ